MFTRTTLATLGILFLPVFHSTTSRESLETVLQVIGSRERSNPGETMLECFPRLDVTAADGMVVPESGVELSEISQT